MTAFIYIILSIIIAMLGYLIIPDNTPEANRQALELAVKPPGFSVLTLRMLKTEEYRNEGFIHWMLFGKKDPYQYIPVQIAEEGDGMIKLRGYTGDNSMTVGDTLYTITKAEVKYKLITQKFILGTDQFGRDVLSRLILGSRVSLAIGFISVLISLFIGILIGSLAGYYKGWVDKAALWLINVIWSVPALLLVIAITFALGKGFWQVFIAVGFTMWVEVARVTRGQIFSIREKEYIEAARALGFSDFRIIMKHILPNISGPVIVISAANFASAILIEAGLSFLGIGVQPPMPSWGGMIRENYAYLVLGAP
jgi:peptide/nickel transport system permease protein